MLAIGEMLFYIFIFLILIGFLYMSYYMIITNLLGYIAIWAGAFIVTKLILR